jgi:hypothetical protein
VWGIVLNAIADGEPTTQARIGIGVPAAAMALVFSRFEPPGPAPQRRRGRGMYRRRDDRRYIGIRRLPEIDKS